MPTVIVLDDLHWADTASLDLLLSVAALVEDLPLLITCLLRPDKDAPSWSAIEKARSQLGARYTEILLEPLDADIRRCCSATCSTSRICPRACVS